MNNIKDYIESGILELYVSGNTTAAEAQEVERMAEKHQEIREELKNISTAIEQYAMANAIEPDITVKPFLLATINYTERLMKGEVPTSPPVLNDNATPKDYAQWIDRDDMVLTPDFKDYYARIIGYTPEALTAIVWIKDMAPEEMHDSQLEKFLILEGTCTITIEGEDHYLEPGSMLTIPLFKNHTVKVTSLIPCKLILQRVAA